jgi:hypothetical protein
VRALSWYLVFSLSEDSKACGLRDQKSQDSHPGFWREHWLARRRRMLEIANEMVFILAYSLMKIVAKYVKTYDMQLFVIHYNIERNLQYISQMY